MSRGCVIPATDDPLKRQRHVGPATQAGVANELSKLYAATLGGFAPVALGMFPDAADRPHGAYKDLTPASLPDEAADQARAARCRPFLPSCWLATVCQLPHASLRSITEWHNLRARDVCFGGAVLRAVEAAA
jgi:hypothetical protein